MGKSKIQKLEEDIDYIEDTIKGLKKAVGYEVKHAPFPIGIHYNPPEISVTEYIDKLCEYLGIEIIKRPESIEVIKHKK